MPPTYRNLTRIAPLGNPRRGSQPTMNNSTEVSRTHLSRVGLGIPDEVPGVKGSRGLGRRALPAEPGGPGLRPAALGLRQRKARTPSPEGMFLLETLRRLQLVGKEDAPGLRRDSRLRPGDTERRTRGALQPRHTGTNGIGVELHPAARLRIPRQHRDADVGTWLDLDLQALEEARAAGKRQDRWRRADLDLCPPRPDRAAV